MTQEQKAKAYDEAIKRAKTMQEKSNGMILKKWLWGIFPELKESKDERIRNVIRGWIYARPDSFFDGGISKEEMLAWLEKQGKEEYALNSSKHEDVYKFMQYIEKNAKAYEFNLPNRGYDIYAFAKDILVWLEKQGEQKPADKVQPKFKVGDWIVSDYNNVAYIESIGETKYNLQCKDGYHEKMSIEYIDRCWHLWSIEDAKDGDVLTYKNDDIEWILIYKNILPEYHDVPNHVLKYHALFTGTDFYHNRINSIKDKNYASCFTPATKEQRDHLFAKMREAGYEWNEEKKELKWIKQVDDFDTELKESKDEIIRKALIQGFNECLNSSSHYPKNSIKYWHGIVIEDIIAWIEKQAPKQEWSDEDEELLQHCCGAVTAADYYTLEDKEEMENWLKSLKQRIGG